MVDHENRVRVFELNTCSLFDGGYAAVQGKIMASNRRYNLLTNLLGGICILCLGGSRGDLYILSVRRFLEKTWWDGIYLEILIKEEKFSKSLIDDFELSIRVFRKEFRIAFAPLSIVYDEDGLKDTWTC